MLKRLVTWKGWESPWLAAVGVGGSAALAAAIVRWVSAFWGLGANSDGLAYLILTRSLLAWKGYGYPLPDGGIKPMTHFPPGYPLTLAGLSALGLTPENAALVVSMVSFAALIGFAGWAMYRVTHHAWPVVGLAAWLAVAFGTLRIYAWVLSETLFMAWLFFVGWALARWLEAPSRRRALLVGLAAGWLVYIRWIGLVALAWVGLVMLWAWWRRKAVAWSEAAWALVGGVLPPLLLMGVNHLWAGAATNRRILWHPPGAAKWRAALQTLADWLGGAFVFPKAMPWGWGALVLLGALAAVALGWRWGWLRESAPRERFRALLVQWGAFIGVYFVALVAAITLADAATPMDWRLLAPLLPPASLVVGAALWGVLRSRPRAAAAATALWAVFLLATLVADHHAFFDARWGGVALRSFRWQQARIWEDARALPPDALLLTNELEATIYYTRRPAQPLVVPAAKGGRLVVVDSSTKEARVLPYPDMETWGRAVAERLEGRCAAVVYVTLKAPENRALEDAFRLIKREKSGLLLAPPGSETCLGVQP